LLNCCSFVFLSASYVDDCPLPTWHRDRVILVGDAAHPTPPNLAQGAAAALEDGFTLAAALLPLLASSRGTSSVTTPLPTEPTTAELSTAMTAWEMARRNRVVSCRNVTRMTQWLAEGVLDDVRDVLLPAVPAAINSAVFDAALRYSLGGVWELPPVRVA
jgi:2-polyprenyl-6-methoxyphenol hydroxylase-like FAD-dependent oxidoreductase